MLLKDYFRFRAAFIVITPDDAVSLRYHLAEQILDGLCCLQGLKVFNSLNIEVQNVTVKFR